MSGFDLIVLFIVGVAAVGGFMRGFVQEVLSLAAWVLAVLAIRALHTDLYQVILEQAGGETTSGLLAFALLLLVPYAGMKLIAGRLGEASRSSMLGPIDRVLGFGFGALKGSIVAVLAFSILVLGYDTIWGYQGRPVWMTTARTYPVINAASKDMVELIAERRAELQAEAEAEEAAN
ncbi:MAG: CvpA family protein [Sphingomonadaceae bacterium]|nr:CvpA family protein [Sphingomonadaceae bacterium]